MGAKLQMKAWRLEMAERLHVTEKAIVMRLKRGCYRHKIRIQRKNPRVVFVVPHPKIGELFPH